MTDPSLRDLNHSGYINSFGLLAKPLLSPNFDDVFQNDFMLNPLKKSCSKHCYAVNLLFGLIISIFESKSSISSEALGSNWKSGVGVIVGNLYPIFAACL